MIARWFNKVVDWIADHGAVVAIVTIVVVGVALAHRGCAGAP